MVRVEGHVGALQVGYQVAAELRAWTLELLPEAPRRYQLTARVAAVSDYWLAQAPLDLAVQVGRHRWLWHGVTPSIDGRTITVLVRGAPTVTDLGLWPEKQEQTA